MTKMFYGRVWVFLVPSNKYVNTPGVDLHAVYWVAYNHGFFLVCIWLLFCFETLQAPTCICHPGHWRAVNVPSKWCPWLEIRFPSNLSKLIRNHQHGKQVWSWARRHLFEMELHPNAAIFFEDVYFWYPPKTVSVGMEYTYMLSIR